VATSVNDVRLDLFTQKQRHEESIPPTQAALTQHVKNTAYQVGCVWGQATVKQPNTTSPANWRWIKQAETWHVHWTALSPIATSCQELTQCGCKQDCGTRCKCQKLGLTCTAPCSCSCDENGKLRMYHKPQQKRQDYWKGTR